MLRFDRALHFIFLIKLSPRCQNNLGYEPCMSLHLDSDEKCNFF